MLLSRKPCSLSSLLVVIGGFIHASNAQLPSTWPMAYPGMPTTAYGPAWQSYFQVTDALPNVTFQMPRTYAGSVSVNRTGHANNTLFFVAFEKEDGSLAANDGDRATEPWMVWLNGGPGSSSMYGLFSEHGPLRYGLNSPDADSTDTSSYSLGITENPWSWHKLSDIFYIDQPVGTGYSTSDSRGYIVDEDQMGVDFAGFLGNIVSIFPSLKKRPLHIVGESYAGTYIPYITKTLIGMETPPVNLVNIAIGDGAMGNFFAFREFPALNILQSYPQLIGFNTSVYEYFVDQYNLCGYNLELKYPNPSLYPTLSPSTPPNKAMMTRSINAMRNFQQASLKQVLDLYSHDANTDADETLINGKRFVKRQSTGTDTPQPTLGPLGTIDSYYGCFLMEHIEDFAVNFTTPWVGNIFDVYRIADAMNPIDPSNPAAYLNDPAVRAALHAPNKRWIQSITYPFNNTDGTDGNIWGDPSVEPQVFLSDLAKRVKMVFFSGNDDSLVGHRGTELAIQNMTFGGIRGFTARPSTPFSDVDGNFAGVIHQERNVTYALFEEAGHMIPRDVPKAAYAFLREFVLGSNTTGLLRTENNATTVEGGVHTQYLKGVLTGTYAITGAQITQGTYTWARESFAKWDSYMATRTAGDAPVASATGDGIISPGSLDAGPEGAATMTAVGYSGLAMGIIAGFCSLML